MLSFTRKVDYTLIALVSMAEECGADSATGKPMSARQIAQRHHLPTAMVMNLLKTLNKAGVVKAQRGARGGYTLAAPPDRLRVIDIVEAVDGPIRMTPCCEDFGLDAAEVDEQADAAANPALTQAHDENHRNCKIGPTCPIMLPIKRLNQRVVGLLEGLSLADLLAETQQAAGVDRGNGRA